MSTERWDQGPAAAFKVQSPDMDTRTARAGSLPRSVFAWAVHAFTATGVVMALCALLAVFDGRYRHAFLWLIAATAVDAVDGWLARLADVQAHAPSLDGRRLDDIVDYLTYVFVPAVLIWRVPLLPDRWALPIAAAVLMASAFGFSRTHAKTADHFFVGFPSYWNVVALYLYVSGLGAAWNAVVVTILAALVLVPVRYVYPSRTAAWRPATVALGGLWAIGMCAIVWRLPDVTPALVVASLPFPIYYVLLSLVLHARRQRAGRLQHEEN